MKKTKKLTESSLTDRINELAGYIPSEDDAKAFRQMYDDWQQNKDQAAYFSIPAHLVKVEADEDYDMRLILMALLLNWAEFGKLWLIKHNWSGKQLVDLAGDIDTYYGQSKELAAMYKALKVDHKNVAESFANTVDEDIKKHDTLNPKIWEDGKLKEDVAAKLKLIAYSFLERLCKDGVYTEIIDIILLGSNCSYNYTKDSDIDLHIVVDPVKSKIPVEIAPLLYSAYRSLFNKNYNITFYGIPVEIFVDIDEPNAVSNGKYSLLNNTWIKEPEIAAIPDIDQDAFDKQFQEWEDRYHKIEANPDLDSIDKCITDLYEKRKNGIAVDGEYALDNLLFKEFRNRGYLDKLKELKQELRNKDLSLESLHEDVEVPKSIIADQIRGEWEAIQNYGVAADELATIGDFDSVVALLNDIADEEATHVGELQQALFTIDTKAEANIEAGHDEADEKLANSVENS